MKTSTLPQLSLHILSYVILMNALVYSYIYYQIPIWGYLGYEMDYSVTRHIVANFASVVLGLITPRKIDNLRSFVLVLVSSSTIVTLISLYAARGYEINYLISVLLFVGIVKTISSQVRFKIPQRKIPIWPVITISIIFIMICIAWIILRGGLGQMQFNILEIYSVREVAMSTFFVGPFAYFLNWAQKGFGTAIFALGLMKRSYILIAFAISTQIFFYATLGQKMPLAMLVFVVIAIYLSRSQLSAIALNGLIVFGLFLSAILFDWLGLQGLLMNSIFVKRIFFAPAEGAILHFEFFSENQFTYFSDSFLHGVIDFPFFNSVMELISIEMTGEIGINPNVGIIATGYQHMGYLGLFIYAITSALILSVFESISKGQPTWVLLSIAGLPMYILFTSSDLVRVMLTHGGLVAMFIIFLWPASTNLKKL